MKKEPKHTMTDLYQMQALPLESKIQMTKYRIAEWVKAYGSDGVYVSFSGGKDSTVLLDLVRQDYPDIEAMFVDVPTQFPELREFAMTFPNVTIIKPKMTFMEVVEKYGFPLISKEVSESVYGAKKYLTSIMNDIENPHDTTRHDTTRHDTIFHTITSMRNSEELANMLQNRKVNRLGGQNQRLAIMLGMLAKNQTIKANIPREERSTFGQAKWGFLLGADFDISNRCCTVMKKNPAHDFHKKTGKNPMIATMASESKLRTQKWLQNGCNGFDLAIPTSTPMSFWTEQDVLLYIKTHNLPICSVYGDVVEEIDENHVEGQMTISDLDGFEKMWLFDAERPTLKTTGCQRTGCALCGFGAHCRKDERFLELKSSHPKMYDLLDVVQNNGVTMREAIEWVNEHGNVNIKL